MSTRRFDVHVHTTFSHDGRSPMAAYAARIDEGAADGIGFAEHYEFWPGSGAKGYLDVAAYRAEVAAWREKGYSFLAGVEVDWVPEHAGEIQAALAHGGFAFVIGSVHNLTSASVSSRDTSAYRDDTVFDRIITEYGEAVTSSLTMDEFDVVGHPGVFLRHFGPEYFEGKPWLGRLKALEDNLAREIAASGKLLEVNTASLFYARRETCAGPFLLERYRAYGGRAITLASDSHEAGQLRRGFTEAAQMLARLGFDEVCLPWDREHPVPLDEFVR
jgi:histidinol-phosphatase (PHP family)